MNEEFRKRAIIAALNYRVPQDRDSLDEAIASQTSWTAVCKACLTHIRGTLAQIREHKCDHSHNP